MYYIIIYVIIIAQDACIAVSQKSFVRIMTLRKLVLWLPFQSKDTNVKTNTTTTISRYVHIFCKYFNNGKFYYNLLWTSLCGHGLHMNHRFYYVIKELYEMNMHKVLLLCTLSGCPIYRSYFSIIICRAIKYFSFCV